MSRMAVMGQPTPLMREILNEIRFVQDQTRVAIAPGRLRREVYEVGRRAIEQCKFGKSFGFVTHGMGLIAHEAPRLWHNDEIGYDGAHAERALEAGMVLSIETGIKDPEAGFIKLEDTVIVTESGWEAYGDWGRDAKAWTAKGASFVALASTLLIAQKFREVIAELYPQKT
jgi:Xaa-Pro aminopeptidase